MLLFFLIVLLNILELQVISFLPFQYLYFFLHNQYILQLLLFIQSVQSRFDFILKRSVLILLPLSDLIKLSGESIPNALSSAILLLRLLMLFRFTAVILKLHLLHLSLHILLYLLLIILLILFQQLQPLLYLLSCILNMLLRILLPL
jgi:hypothetical protein